MPHFSINVSINIQPPEIKQIIEQTCVKLFGQDKGDDETDAEFLERRTEEWILNWFKTDQANLAASQASQSTAAQIEVEASIKKRKDKPKAKPKAEK